MPTSPYILGLRALIGNELLLLPGVAALIESPTQPERYLLHLREDGMGWSFPAGTIEPGESPSEALCREVLEETGLMVEPVEVRAIIGAERGTVTYPNGDRVEHTTTFFQCKITGGELSTEGDETEALAFFGREEILRLKPAFPADAFEPGCSFASPR